MTSARRHLHIDPPRYSVPGIPDLLTGENPRVSFTGVTARVFPLKASMNRLQDFCDNYLNFLDDDPDLPMKQSQRDYFRPAAPYIYFQVINYGQMATETQNLGWIAQNEVLFCLPLEWYKIGPDGQLAFHDWAMICPFIFVDNDMSLMTGRETYGWTKVRGWLEWVPTSWARDPLSPRRLLDLRTEMFTELYSGESPEPRTLVEVIAQQPPVLSPAMLTRRDTFNPIWGIPEAIRNSLKLSGNLIEAITNLPILGYTRRDVPSLRRMSMRAAKNMQSMIPWLPLTAGSATGAVSPNLYFNQVTLKQFRDATEPDYACYQALVNSRITVDHYYDVGALGAANLAAGDMSGGLRVKVHDYAEQPIVKTLGLEVDELITPDEGAAVAILKPTVPFWLSCDLTYDTGDTVAWRGRTSSTWHTAPPASSDKSEAVVSPDASTSAPRQSTTTTSKNSFNNTGGAAIQEVAGPFHYPNTTLRVFPLLADEEKLGKFCDDYLNNIDEADGVLGIDGNFFEPWGSYVYMIVTTYGQDERDGDKMWSEKNNIGSLAESEVSFCVPVKWYVQSDGASPVLEKTAILTPYLFASNSRHAISEREINGRSMLHSIITSDDDSWLKSSGPVRPRSLTKVKTLLIPALNVGEEAEMLDVVEVTEKQPEENNEEIEWSAIKARWAPHLENDFARKSAQIKECQGEDGRLNDLVEMVEGAAKNQGHLNFLALKQYRDTKVADRACYQALVLLRKKIEALFNVQELHRSKHVKIHKYPTLPIVDTLGLIVKSTDSEGSSVVDWLEPIRPFFVHLSFKEELGVKVCGRVNSKDWSADDDDTTDVDWKTTDDEPAWRTPFGLSDEQQAERETKWKTIAQKAEDENKELIALLEQVYEPKAIIEYLLSKELLASHPSNDAKGRVPIYEISEEFGRINPKVSDLNEPEPD